MIFILSLLGGEGRACTRAPALSSSPSFCPFHHDSNTGYLCSLLLQSEEGVVVTSSTEVSKARHLQWDQLIHQERNNLTYQLLF